MLSSRLSLSTIKIDQTYNGIAKNPYTSSTFAVIMILTVAFNGHLSIYIRTLKFNTFFEAQSTFSSYAIREQNFGIKDPR